jgi:FkbM family methyltransferase
VKQHETPLGRFWVENDGDLFGILHEQREGSAHLYERGSVGIRPGDVVIDGGSHIGVITRLAQIRGAACVVAFEVESKILPCFEQTFARELEEGRVRLIKAALWDTETSLHFAGSRGGFHAVNTGVNDEMPHTWLSTTTIDKTVCKLGLPRVDFIKLDLEGAERKALRGAEMTLLLWKPRLAICTYHLPDDPEVLEGIVREIRPDYIIEHGPKPAPGESGGIMFCH